jgi:hypothetical protein
VSFLYKTQRFGDGILSPSSGKSLFSGPQSVELGRNGSAEWAQLSRLLSGDRDRIQFPNRCVLSQKQDDG